MARYQKVVSLTVIALALSSCNRSQFVEQNEVCFIKEIPNYESRSTHYEKMLQVKGGLLLTDPALTAFVREVGYRLARVSNAPHVKYEFNIINNGSVDSWALSEGKIAVHRGLLLLLENEAELAAVLAREIILSSSPPKGGLRTEKGIKGFDLAMANPASLKMSREERALLSLRRNEQELISSDHYSIEILARAGYSPTAAISTQEKLLTYVQKKRKKNSSNITSLERLNHRRVKMIREQAAIFEEGGDLGIERYREQTKRLRKFANAYAKLDTSQHALKKGNDRLAYSLAEQGLERVPHEARFSYVKGVASMRMGRFSDAISYLDEALEKDKSFFDHYLQRGIAYAGLGYSNKALADLEKSITLLNTAEAHYHLGDLLFERRTPNEAIKHFEVAAEVESRVMLLAQEQLVRLDMPQNPSKYVHLNASLDKRGFLSLAVVNDCSIPVRDILVSIDARGSPGIRIPRRVVRFPETTEESGSQMQYTGIGPFENFEQLKRSLQAQIVSASPVREN